MSSKYYKVSLSRDGRNLREIVLTDGRKIPIYVRKVEDAKENIFEDLVLGLTIYPTFIPSRNDAIEDLKIVYANASFLNYSRYERIPDTIFNLERIKETLNSLTDVDIDLYRKQFEEAKNNMRNWFLNFINYRCKETKEKAEITSLKCDIDSFSKKRK